MGEDLGDLLTMKWIREDEGPRQATGGLFAVKPRDKRFNRMQRAFLYERLLSTVSSVECCLDRRGKMPLSQELFIHGGNKSFAMKVKVENAQRMVVRCYPDTPFPDPAFQGWAVFSFPRDSGTRSNAKTSTMFSSFGRPFSSRLKVTKKAPPCSLATLSRHLARKVSYCQCSISPTSMELYLRTRWPPSLATRIFPYMSFA